MSTAHSDILVVTDLDGTLLDHHSYSWAPASRALAALNERQIPLVLCSSKTAAEMQALREALGLASPFIVENGAAVYLPASSGDAEIHAFGLSREDILPRLQKLNADGTYRYTGFADMTVADVVAATGLDESGAANALQREFTEPLLWQDTEANKARFLKAIRRVGLDAVQGGRFLHVSSGCDKGRAVDWLRGWFAKHYGHAPLVVALGDSDNDISMLESADQPVLVKSPVRDYPDVKHADAIRTEGIGPVGWNAAILNILKLQDGK